MGRSVSGGLAAVAVLAGCGEKAGPEDNAHSAVATFLGACERGDAVAAQYALNEPAKRVMLEAQSPREGCVLVLGISVAGTGPGADIDARAPDDALLEDTLAATEITAVEADGGFATVELDAPVGSSSVDLERLRGEWYIGAAGARE